jgi:D-3-phosphoglycerate dehydrogenase
MLALEHLHILVQQGLRMSQQKILLTDYPWPNLDIERRLIEAARFQLVAGPSVASNAAAIEALVAEHNPVGIMTCWSQVSAAAIAKPRELKVIARLGVGLDNIDVAAATARGAWVTNVPDYCVEEVSDHVIAMLLNWTRGISVFDTASKRGEWNPSSAQLLRARNLTVGVIGYGRIGSVTVRKLSLGFGCRVLVNAPSLLEHHAPGAALSQDVYVAHLKTIQAQADVIVLHLPLTQTTQHFVNDEFLAVCQRQPYLINVSRGGLVDNQSLIRALESKHIAGAALDVVEGEPSPPMELVKRSDVVVTPHIAFTSDASLRELRERCTADVLRVLRSERPLHPCNSPAV